MEVDNIEQFKVTKSDAVSYTIQPLEVFIKYNPEYANLDTLASKYVIYGNGEAETLTAKYRGFKKVNKGR